MTRKENLNQLINEKFDICVIGGGASGAGVALDAALRGYKVALIEKNDFASATSSKSTKLIHGGVRYLEQAFKNLDLGQLNQVKHGLAERAYVLKNAPHLASPLALLTPVFSWFEGFYFSIGLKLYSLFAVNDSLPKSEWLTKEKTLEELPTLSPKLHSAVKYFDGQLDDARYCLSLCLSADKVGAATVNYAQVERFNKNNEGKIVSATVKNLIAHKENEEPETIELKASLFINCTGPFSDSIRTLANPKIEPRIRPSKGVHLVLPKKYLPGTTAMLIPKTKDGRVVFVLPFENVVIVGTTDTPYTDLSKEPILEEAEVDYLLETMDVFFNEKPKRSEIKSGFGGLRPLVAETKRNSQDTKSLLRDHVVELDDDSGLLSLLGGKWTTYRLMAQDTLDQAEKLLGRRKECQTKTHYLVGGEGFDPEFYKTLTGNYKLTEGTAKHLNSKYGTCSLEIAKLVKDDPELGKLVHPKYPYILAEVVYAVRVEQAVKLRDFFARRTRFELQDWNAVIQSVKCVATIMAKELNWNVNLQLEHERSYLDKLEKFKKTANI